jgi:2-dehydropantoate 2-reductase
VRVVVLGAGAVGGLFGALLSRAKHEVLLVAREEEVVVIRLDGLRIEGRTEGVFELPAVDALPDGIHVDALLLTVKAPDVRAAGAEIARRLRPLPPILALQNGLGIERSLIEGLESGPGEILPGTITRAINSVPVTRLGPGRLRHAGEGEVLFDTPDLPRARASVERFVGLLASASVPIRRVPEISREIWRKVIVNAAINPVTAEHGIPNGRLAVDPWRRPAEELLHEAQRVAAAEGFDFPDAEVEADLWRIVRATAQNRSSMLQDVQRRHRTEIEAISGALLRFGDKHGLELPATRQAYDRIRALEPVG